MRDDDVAVEVARTLRRARPLVRWRRFLPWHSRRAMTTALLCGDAESSRRMAGAVAGELGLHLYRVDLSAVVSKYIGETEKNLRRLFDAAESGGTLLFFDEADALFGKRSEVKDSHDRSANIEVNYLLTRLESWPVATLIGARDPEGIDPCIRRRLRLVVELSDA